ncbi:hypothetical protein HYALB_00002749 [Hymenoscyphus albidus]|uniref:Uncharacterized protein n=1 Tax=Hymenoscyphus albidus TaxID=595503 RepID=A0A9N9Q3T0_9HELO|nr:hypothetical protein HYALB_00002749 [Hymenoscyphus albidus]
MPPLMETVTVINKSGKVISTGKQLVNIFQEAKAAYNEKKAERKELLRAEQRKRLAYKQAQHLIQAREDVQSVASSRHSRRSSRSHRQHKDRAIESRPPLSHIPEQHEGSLASSRRSRSSQPRSRRAPSIDGSQYTTPYFEDAPGNITRRNTDFAAHGGQVARTEAPSNALYRSASDPDVHKKDKVDMNLAYGELHQPSSPASPAVQEQDLEATMTKLDTLLLEAECLHHSATAIIANLQSNPEAMAAVALTLAELSNIIKSMGPTILNSLKVASPAAFALLASPQFLIAGGVALGVTIVMFGGYKIVKQIQANSEAIQASKVEANRMEEPMAYERLEVGSEMGSEMSSIESWRRGIADVEEQSVATSVDGEFITPMAANQKKERIKERAMEERKHSRAPSSLFSVKTSKTSKTSKTHRSKSVRESKNSDVRTSTFEPRAIPVRSASSRVAPSESGRSTRSHRSEKSKDLMVMNKDVIVKEEKKKKPSALRTLFNKHKEKHERDLSAHRPKMLEIAA